jgi:hypothetical protein
MDHNNIPQMQCTRCGQWLPETKLERMKTGTRRRVCNHCKWLYYVQPSRHRRILRELEQRRPVAPASPVTAGPAKCKP